MWRWLIEQGLFKDLLAILIASIWAKVFRISRALKQLSDHLDTSTPGGITDLIKVIVASDDKERKHEEEEPDDDDPSKPKVKTHHHYTQHLPTHMMHRK